MGAFGAKVSGENPAARHGERERAQSEKEISYYTRQAAALYLRKLPGLRPPILLLLTKHDKVS